VKRTNRSVGERDPTEDKGEGERGVEQIDRGVGERGRTDQQGRRREGRNRQRGA
jgi:hypothetical protein